MVDENGFRLNVGIILVNDSRQLFWGRRLSKKEMWQFPQGGIQNNETPEQAMYRELYEEIGLTPGDVKLLGQTQGWFCYYLPPYLQRANQKPFCVGQKQKWFLLQLTTDEKMICFTRTPSPEFMEWRWVDYYYPIDQVIAFKKEVYKNVLKEFESLFQGPHA